MPQRHHKQHQQRSEDNPKLEERPQRRRFHPIFAALAAFLLAIGYALATNPSHSVAADWTFVAAAMFGLYSAPLPTTISVVGIIVALGIGVWLTLETLRPEHVPKNSQRTPTTSKSRFSEEKEHFAARLGGVNIMLDAKKQPKTEIKMGNITPVTAQIVDRKVRVDAQLFDANIKLIGDDLYGRPPTWDSNSDNTALEIVDESGQPIFQIEYLNDQLAVLYGFFCVGESCLFAFPDKSSPTGGFIMAIHKNEIGEHRLSPIFKYPSARHSGERVNPQ
jgi:hypothetical protein